MKKTSWAYYNEIDPYCVEWLRNLIREGLIAPGEVDDRDIRDVYPKDLVGFRQCHFFAGLAGWSYALSLAGWPDDRPVWTGSCPCQPFSAAGKGGGFTDERHLWPTWFHLISVCKPPVVFGEQVASKDGLGWYDLVQTDLEGAGYAVGAADLCAAGVGAPHIRQRLWFVADTYQHGKKRYQSANWKRSRVMEDGILGHASGAGLAGRESQPGDDGEECPAIERTGGAVGELADTPDRSIQEPGRKQEGRNGDRAVNPWQDAEWLPCRDGKWRSTKPGLFPLAHGVPARVGRLRAYGNAIVPEVAAEFIKAYLL